MRFWILLVGVFFLSLRLSAKCDSLYNNPRDLPDAKLEALSIQAAYRLNTCREFYIHIDSLTQELKHIREYRLSASLEGERYSDTCPILSAEDFEIMNYINHLYNGQTLFRVGYASGPMNLTRNLKILSYFKTQWHFLPFQIKNEIVKGWAVYIDYKKVEFNLLNEYGIQLLNGNYDIADTSYSREEALHILEQDRSSYFGKLMWDYNQLIDCLSSRYYGLLVPYGTPEPPDYEPKYS